MQHSRRAEAGLSTREVAALSFVLALFVISLLGVLALPALTDPNYIHPSRPMCRYRLRQLFQGARMYLNNYDDYFPPAWHEGSGDGFGQVTYSRFLVQMATDTSIDFHEAKDDAAKAEMFEENVRFWSDPAAGLTNDYFSPPAVFRLPAPDEMRKPFRRHTHYAQLTARVGSIQMPFLAGVNASTPRPDGPYHVRAGIPNGVKGDWFTVDGVSYDVFYGVARSYSGDWNPETDTGTGEERFDFRHNGAVNVMFLDGHVDTIKKSHGDRMTKLHDNWNIDSEGAP